MTISQSTIAQAVPRLTRLPWFRVEGTVTHIQGMTQTTQSALTTRNTISDQERGALAASTRRLTCLLPLGFLQTGAGSAAARECEFFCGTWNSDYKATDVAHKRLLRRILNEDPANVSVPNMELVYFTRTQVKADSPNQRKDWICVNSSPLPGPFTGGGGGRGIGGAGICTGWQGPHHSHY